MATCDELSASDTQMSTSNELREFEAQTSTCDSGRPKSRYIYVRRTQCVQGADIWTIPCVRSVDVQVRQTQCVRITDIYGDNSARPKHRCLRATTSARPKCRCIP